MPTDVANIGKRTLKLLDEYRSKYNDVERIQILIDITHHYAAHIAGSYPNGNGVYKNFTESFFNLCLAINEHKKALRARDYESKRETRDNRQSWILIITIVVMAAVGVIPLFKNEIKTVVTIPPPIVNVTNIGCSKKH